MRYGGVGEGGGVRVRGGAPNKGFARRQQEFMGWELGGIRYGGMEG